MKHIWGIDLGGTKIEGVILEPGRHLHPICRMRVPSNAEKGYEHVTGQLQKLFEMMQQETKLFPGKIGMGTPGILDPQGQVMKNCNSLCLNGMPLKKDMERLLGIPVEIANDANCFALAEARYGIVQDVVPGAQVVFGVIMGTGVGGGVVFNNRMWNGKQGIAGEWGHTTLDETGPPCYCGKRGCVEQIISGPALENYYRSLSGESLALKEIAERAKQGVDADAIRTIKHMTDMFGKAISIIINILDPDAIVIGGGVGNIEAIYTEGVKEIRKYIFNNRVETVVLRPKLGDSAGVFGAACLVEE